MIIKVFMPLGNEETQEIRIYELPAGLAEIEINTGRWNVIGIDADGNKHEGALIETIPPIVLFG